MNTPAQTSAESLPAAAGRIRSVDALRGFDMFWILGAVPLVKALDKMSGNAFTRFLTAQLTHVQWAGVVFYDFIFPLFLFIIGVSLVFSLDRALVRDGRAKVAGHIVRRSVLLFLFGVFYSGGLSHRWPDVAMGGVLQRIAACYLAASLLYVWCSSRLKVIAGIATSGHRCDRPPL